MEISSSGSSAAAAPAEAQVALQKKASKQKERVVSTLLDSARESVPPAQSPGKNLINIA